MKNNNNKRPIIVFDLGGVLIEWGMDRLSSQRISDPVEMAWFQQNVVTQSWSAQMGAGKPFAEAVAELSADFTQFLKLVSAKTIELR